MTTLMSRRLATFAAAGVGAAATLAGLATTTAAPAAHAESCTVNGSQLQLRVHPNYTYTVTVNANGSNLAGDVFSTVAGQDGVSGNASGSIAGNTVDFIVTWNPADGGGTAHFSGTVGNDGFAHGTATGASAQDLNKHLEFEPGPWESVAPLTCPAAQAPAARLGVSVSGPTTLPAGMSGTYTVNLSNSGDVSAPVELYVSYGGQLQQTGQVTPSGGFNCEVINNAGGTTAVHCTAPPFQSKATANITVQGRGSAPGAGHLTVNINSSDPAAQFVQKSQQLNVTIT
ncbi:MAG: hypothetical protein QOF88_5107 [Mycobacterium sp.]|nr:hypothetical protein [Mycobacterium sp.]